MEYRRLGKTEFIVSRICFGALTVGPLQKNLSFEEGGRVISEALTGGVNMIDTAELYGTYGHIKEGIKVVQRDKVHIMTKSYAYDKKTAEESLKKALTELGTDYVDGFLLHEQESEHTLRGHWEAFEYFMKKKEEGYIRSLGISSHCLAAIKAAVDIEEIDVVHPIVNKIGIGINDGNIDQMLALLKRLKEKDKGIYSMKPLGGGHLIGTYDEAIDFVMGIEEVDSIAMGMQNLDEVKANLLKFSGKEIPLEIQKNLKSKNRTLQIADWCTGCGNCVRRCKQKALKIENQKAVVDYEKCVLCSYCAKVCPDFCIKVI